ncbi:MFS transporter [Pseudomonas sp. CC120222-01a]|uniref:MFS transporter n=1 Tax=Pseudomonas sp. CC120222-01a TaxID=1378075 RepID=UPI000D9FAD1F|nr:MFS transporter [Pseudomonas sp. CC120222-01a]PVZ41222.1 sugar phosphate permease [Pseudomonas sp. CC120222-01a]
MELTDNGIRNSSIDLLESAYRRMSWRLIPFLFLCYILAYFARINVSFAKLQMLTDLNISETAYGLGAGIFFIGYVVFAVPSNLILERVGPRRWIGTLMVTWGLLTVAMMLTSDVSSFYVFRFLIGVAEAGFFPGVIYFFTRWFPSERRGRVIAMFMAAAPLSSVIGGPISGWVMQAMTWGAMGLSNWQWLFVIYGVPTVAVGLMVKHCLPNSFEEATFLSSTQKQLVRQALQRDLAKNVPAPRAGHSRLAFLRSPVVWYFSMVYFFIEMGEYALGFWMPTIIQNSGFSDLRSIGLLSAVPYLVASIVMIVVGRSSDLRRERRLHLAISLLIGMAGLIIAARFAHHGAVAMVGLTLATCGVMAAFPVFWSVPTTLLGASAAAGVALINSIGNLAGLVSPWLVGWTVDLTHSTDLALYIVAACAFLGAMLFAFAPSTFNKG